MLNLPGADPAQAPVLPPVTGPGGILTVGHPIKVYPTVTTDADLMQCVGYIPEPIHCLNYGLSGSGKSLFARTWPTPWLIMGWDTYDNMRSYTKGLVTVSGTFPWNQMYPVEYTDCFTPEGGFVGRIEHYAEPLPEAPRAYMTYSQRSPYLGLEYTQQYYGFTPRTVIWDSLTFSSNAAVLYHMAQQGSESAFKMSGHAKTSLIRDILSRLAWLRCNVVVIAHLAKPEDKEEYNTGLVRGVAAVGTLGSELPSGFGEVYRSFIVNRPNQDEEYWLQTHGDSIYAGKSISGVPNPCQPHYLALWDTRV